MEIFNRAIDNPSYSDAIFNYLLKSWNYIVNIFKFLNWTPNVIESRETEETERLLGDNDNGNNMDDDTIIRNDNDNMNDNNNDNDSFDLHDQRLAQFEKYLLEKKKRKIDKKYKKYLKKTASSLTSEPDLMNYKKRYATSKTDAGSVISSNYSSLSFSTNSPHESNSSSAFALSQDDLLNFNSSS